MTKKELLKDLKKAREALKDHTKFIHLFSDKPKGTLTRLNERLSRIEFLLKASDCKDVVVPPDSRAVLSEKAGYLVTVRPCGEEYKNKTYLGFYIGDVAHGASLKTLKKKLQVHFSSHNPAIFVPELGKIIYGYESWWGRVKSEKDLKDITDADIMNVWYVKALMERAMGNEINGGIKNADT